MITGFAPPHAVLVCGAGGRTGSSYSALLLGAEVGSGRRGHWGTGMAREGRSILKDGREMLAGPTRERQKPACWGGESSLPSTGFGGGGWGCWEQSGGKVEPAVGVLRDKPRGLGAFSDL